MKIAPPPQLQGSEAERSRGPSLGLPASEINENVHTVTSVSMPGAAQPERRPISSPTPVRSTIRDITSLGDMPADGAHRSPLSDLPVMSEDQYETNPFDAMPELEDCPLGGLRSGLTHPLFTASTSERQVDNMYAEQGDKRSPFMALDLPPELPLSTYQRQADSSLKKQQRSNRSCSRSNQLHDGND